ncbi:MAG: aminopeptidase [Nitrospirota bacterium]
MPRDDALHAIFGVNLALRRAERVLVFTDLPSPEENLEEKEREQRRRLPALARRLARVGREDFGAQVRYVEFGATGSHGAEPPSELWRAAFGDRAVDALRDAGLLAPLIAKTLPEEGLARAEEILLSARGEAVQAVAALSHYSTSHTAFRRFLTRLAGARFASMPLFDEEMLSGPMLVDWQAMARRTRAVAALLGAARQVQVTTPEGTSLAFSTGGREGEADTGLLSEPGSFGNLPAGEAYLAPLEGTARGRLVLLWAPTRKLASPVTLQVEGGRVRHIEGREEFASTLAGRLSEREENANVAEFGVGTNDRASRADNILESEKILGTVHVALGDNSAFGGRVKTPFHQDFVFFGPTVVLTLGTGERRSLLREGTLAL